MESHTSATLYGLRTISKRKRRSRRTISERPARLQSTMDRQLHQTDVRHRSHTQHQPTARTRPQQLQLHLLPLRLHIYRPNAHKLYITRRQRARPMPGRMLQLHLYRSNPAARGCTRMGHRMLVRQRTTQQLHHHLGSQLCLPATLSWKVF